ncbi:MAG: type transport system ATP-binding protein [Chloroflexota bacterium]|nr:type transport system ATP-binding protein [Chloroflexota bacterium]
MASALAFESVTKRYRNGVVALDGASWSIPVGARTCLLGPNGAGKSTAIRLLEGALRPTSGSVTLLETTPDAPDYPAARRRTGIVPQSPGMYADLSTDDYLTLVRRLYGRGDVARVIEAFGLAPYRRTMLAQLSGGFRRRLLLAAALLSEPEVLLLDEPTVGLDPVAAHDVHAFLATAMRGRTTLLCTHNLAEAEALCDDVVILRAGRVLLHEPLAELRARVAPRLRVRARQPVASLVAALARRGLAADIDGDAAIVSVEARGAAPDLLRALLGEGIDVFEATPLEPSLEQLFLDVVRS